MELVGQVMVTWHFMLGVKRVRRSFESQLQMSMYEIGARNAADKYIQVFYEQGAKLTQESNLTLP
jgi:hypothetical protein